MKIEGPKSTSRTGSSKKSGKASDSSGADFSSFISNTAGEAEQSAASQSMARVEGLLAVQAAEDPMQGQARKRMVSRARDILDELDKIKMALLNGNLRATQIENISSIVAQSRDRIEDPELSFLLDEIDLRAQVEMTKLEMAKEAALAQMRA